MLSCGTDDTNEGGDGTGGGGAAGTGGTVAAGGGGGTAALPSGGAGGGGSGNVGGTGGGSGAGGAAGSTAGTAGAANTGGAGGLDGGTSDGGDAGGSVGTPLLGDASDGLDASDGSFVLPSPSEASALIQAAYDAGYQPTALPIAGAIVTYLKPEVGVENPAFYVQAEQAGPALLIEVDPASLTPPPTVGATVSFVIDTMVRVDSVLRVTQISDFRVHATGANVEALRQDLSSAADLASTIDSYESELIRVSGTVTSDFEFNDPEIGTALFDTGGLSLQLRLGADVVLPLGLETGCTFTLNGVMWDRLPSAYYVDDITNGTCPAPVVESAVAMAADSVVIHFNRLIDASSVNPDGSQFAFTQGLTASAAVVSGSTVTVTTSAQTPGTSYGVSVDGSVLDVFGVGVGPPGSATFDGYTTPAVVLVNEVACLGSGGPEDYIELYVVQGGPMGDFVIGELAIGSTTPQEEYRFDPGFTVSAGDYVVLHYDSANQGSYKQEDDSGSSKTESNATDHADTAWDVYTNLSYCDPNDSFVLVRDNFGTVVDSVALSNRDGTLYIGMRDGFNAIRADGSMAWSGFSVDGDGTNDSVVQNECAPLGATASESAQRDSDYTPGGGGIGDTDTNAEWCAAAQTMGTPNVDCP